MTSRIWLNSSVVLVLTLTATAGGSQTPDRPGTAPDTSYAPGPAHPFGRPHPKAPAQLQQFAFMIGEFDCVDEIRQRDGTWIRFRAIWNAKYFLNGYGIQDEYWTPRFFTSNIRIFDEQAGKWKVTFFRMPGYQTGVWSGGKEGDRIVLRRGDRGSGPGLTFHTISADGYSWHSGGDNPGWKSTCRGRR